MRKSHGKRSKFNLNGRSNADLISRFVAEDVYEERLLRFDELDKVEIKAKSNKPSKIVLVLGFTSMLLLIGLAAVLFIINRPDPPLVYASFRPKPDFQELSSPEFLDFEQATDKVLTENDLRSIKVKAIYSFSPELSKVFAIKDQNQKFPIASLTKIMTAVASNKVFAKEDLVCVKEETRLYGSIDLLKDDCFARNDLIAHMLVSSSNDAAEQFRLHSQEKAVDLVALMNSHTKTYNLDQTNYSNAIGLDDANNYSSAKNVAMLYSVLLKDEELLENLSVQEATLRSQTSTNLYKYSATNTLLEERSDVITGKTGFTSEAGGTLVVLTKKRDWDFSLITVILGAEGNDERFEEMSKLLDLIYNEFTL